MSAPACMYREDSTYPGQVTNLVGVGVELLKGTFKVEDIARHVGEAAVTVVQHAHLFLDLGS